MAKRTLYKQNLHDNKVKSMAKSYLNRGFKVKADIRGYDEPPVYNGRQPDITYYDKHGNLAGMAEIETEESLETDEDQRKVLRNVAVKKRIPFATIVARRKK